MKKILILITLVSTIFANDVTSLQSIKDIIHIETGWENIEMFDNGISVSVKEIPNIPVKAVMISQHVDIDPLTIVDIIEDIDNYDNILKSAKSSISTLLFQNDEGTYAHQYLGLKYVRDRHYAFKLYRPFENYNRIDWELIPEDIFNSINEASDLNTSGVYVDIGYGSWVVKKIGNKNIEVSYRLVMHPGGSVPNFVTDYINKVTIVDLFKDVINEALLRSSRRNE